MTEYLLVCDVGGTSVKFGIFDGQVLSHQGKFPTPATWEEFQSQLAKLRQELDLPIKGIGFLQDHFAHVAAGAGAFAAHQVAVVVADDLIEVGDNANGLQDVAAAHRLIGLDPGDAQFAQGPHGVGEQVDGLEDGLPNQWLHDIELELTGLGGEGLRDRKSVV